MLAVCGLLSGAAAVEAGSAAAQADAQQSVAQRCFEHHKFGAQPVDVAKTADGQTVLAQTRWNWHDAIGCYLTLDDASLAALRAAPVPQGLPDAETGDSKRCFEHHQFGQRPVDVAKTADRQTVLARLSWGYHDTIGCYLVLDDTALATLRAAAQPDPTVEPTPDPTPEPIPGAYVYTSVDAGWGPHSCAIHDDETAEFSNVICWGNQNSSQIFPPPGHFTQIAGGGRHTCAIREDRTVACWGWNARIRYGQLDAPLGQFTDIASGDKHSCAIRDDQSVICWGFNEHGQTDTPEGRFSDIAAGNSHSCAIGEDQAIACWGGNSDGQAEAPEGQFREVVGRGDHSCAIATDWTITCWGGNRYGQAEAPEGHYTDIAAGDRHSCAIDTDWTIACWGGNRYGQAEAPEGQYTDISAAEGHTCAIRTDRTIRCWGRNNFGQADAPMEFRAIQAIYAVPSDETPVSGRERAIAHDVSVAQEWFRTQTDGRHPIFNRDGSDISVKTVRLSEDTSYYRKRVIEPDLYIEIRALTGEPGYTPILVYFEGKLSEIGRACGWQGEPRFVVIPLGNCSIALSSRSIWPYGSSGLVAHELTHLLGAVLSCAPNHDEAWPGHANDSRRDILYSGSDADSNNLVLDFGNDDYYNHGRDDCYDITHNPLLARE